MGATFGISSVAGPLLGGFITDHLGWRVLFFVTLPIGVVAFVVIAAFLHLDHQPRKAKVDVLGIVVLSASMVTLLLATSWGGTTYAWGSATIISMFVAGAIGLALFVLIELRVPEPVIPLRLFANSVFTFSNIASFGVAIAMFGAIFYIPVYAQGVHLVDATHSGLITMPLMLAMVVIGILAGLLVTKTGTYKWIILSGITVMALGYVLLSMLEFSDPTWRLTAAMLVVGIGLGACMQNLTLVVQNTADRKDLGIATASSQFFRNIGSTVGIAVFGSIMNSEMPTAIAGHLPADVELPASGTADGIGSILDPDRLAALPEPVALAIRMGLADALHVVFLAAIPVLVFALLAASFIKSVPLRTTLQSPDEIAKEGSATQAVEQQAAALAPSEAQAEDAAREAGAPGEPDGPADTEDELVPSRT
jgi:MFS family permease